VKVAVLKGGPSLERQVSLRSGARVEDALARLGHDARPVDVGADFIEQLEADRPDVAFLALHGRGGEDGTVQELLDIVGIPYTGSGVLACMRSVDKVLTKHLLIEAGLPTPDFFAFSETAFRELGAAEALPAIEERLEFPIVVKPAVEAVPREEDFYDFESRYEIGRTDFVCPANLSPECTARTQELALATYKLVGCRGFARVDLMVEDSTDEPLVLEVNAIPGLTETSLLPMAAEATGIGFDDLIAKILDLALTRVTKVL
jgi:D-alanine-D-alanine ligase